MAPLPPNSTARYRAFYTVGGLQHSIQIRSSATPLVVGGLYDNIFAAIEPSCATIVFDFMEWAPVGSDVFNPVVSGHDGQVYTGVAFVAETAAWAYTFLGRTPGGRRVRFAIFGAAFLGADYRVDMGSPDIAQVITVLNSAGGIIIGIDGLTPVWKPYADVQVNDHWVKVLRP